MTIVSDVATATKMGWQHVMISYLLTREISGCAVCDVTFQPKKSGGATKVFYTKTVYGVPLYDAVLKCLYLDSRFHLYTISMCIYIYGFFKIQVKIHHTYTHTIYLLNYKHTHSIPPVKAHNLVTDSVYQCEHTPTTCTPSAYGP